MSNFIEFAMMPPGSGMSLLGNQMVKKHMTTGATESIVDVGQSSAEIMRIGRKYNKTTHDAVVNKSVVPYYR